MKFEKYANEYCQTRKMMEPFSSSQFKENSTLPISCDISMVTFEQGHGLLSMGHSQHKLYFMAWKLNGNNGTFFVVLGRKRLIGVRCFTGTLKSLEVRGLKYVFFPFAVSSELIVPQVCCCVV